MLASVDSLEQKAPTVSRRLTRLRLVEAVVITLCVLTPIATYLFVVNFARGQLVSPSTAALLLLANLLPYVALIVLVGRRIAIGRAAKAAIAGGGQMHVQLVAVFSLMASVPIVLTVITASVMFQSGVQLWGSERARAALDSTMSLAREGQNLVVQRWTGEATTMAADIAERYPAIPVRSAEFQNWFLYQTYVRAFYHSVLFRVVDGKNVEALYAYEAPDAKVFAARVSGQVLNLLRDEQSFTDHDKDMLWVVTPVDRAQNIFLYVATPNNVDFLNKQSIAADRITGEYQALQARARALQLQFNGALFALALLIVAIATWIALRVADRIVRPIDLLVTASRQVAEGDLTARVPDPAVQDEVGVLTDAFNRMTGRLETQTNQLVTANAQLESRRALIEAVMSGVTAGVISIDSGRNVRLINASATALLRHADEDPVGRPLAEVAPELAALLDGAETEAVVQLATAAEPRTLAVKITRDEGGQVLTFDDITQQLLDQRRAAWSDVARRIAHEIKNPLTPIQLAAERLQRRFGKQIDEGASVFSQLTETIVRQVGDLRRIVDEFSSFARMPKPLFRQESLLDIARQSMFLHEVAHPKIDFRMDADDATPMVCDRRQIGQALTNVIKNAVEAIEARDEGAPKGEITLTLLHEAARVTLTVSDNGIGLPVERDRIVEPYMTTRSRGTGLGLAIVKKIIEEHFGTIGFYDRLGGGTNVILCFDTEMLANAGEADPETAGAEQLPAALTRTGSKS